MATKKRWSDLTPFEQRTIIVGAAVELVLTAWAVGDLMSTPADSVRGPRAAWLASFVVQPFGPLAYAKFGKR